MNTENKYDLVKFIDGKFELEVAVSPTGDTVWLSLDEMAILFERDRSVIGKHVRKIYSQNELDEKTTRAKNARHLQDGRMFKIDVYNLDVIIAVGYRVNSKRGTLFRQWSTKVLNGYLLKGFAVNEERIAVTNENFHNFLLIVNNMQANQIKFNKRLNILEDKVLNKEYEFNKLFFDGQFYDAYTLVQSFFESANNEIIIIDNYVDRSILDRLIVKKSNVKVLIYTNINTSRLIGTDINSFNSQYGGLDVKYNTNVHDRFIIIDQMKFYHLGHSIKDLGKKIFSINELDNNLIQMFLNNI